MVSVLNIYNDFIISSLKWQVEVFSAWQENNLSDGIKMSKMYAGKSPFVLSFKKRANYLKMQGILFILYKGLSCFD